MPADWYFKLGPIVAGPFTKSEFSARVAAGEIRPKTLIRKGPDGNWVPAVMVEGLLVPASVATEAPAMPAEPESAAASTPAAPVAEAVPANPTASRSSRRLVTSLLAVAATGILVCVAVAVVWKTHQSARAIEPARDAAAEQIKRIDAPKDLPPAPPAVKDPEPAKPEFEPMPEEPAENAEQKREAALEALRRKIAEQEAADKLKAADDKRKQQARLLQRIYEQRAILTAQWETAKQKLQHVQNAMSAAETDLARCEAEGAALRQNATILQRQIKDVQDTLIFEKDPSRRAQLQGLLTAGTTAYAQGQARYQSLDAAAGQAKLNYARLQPQAQALSTEVIRLYQQAVQVRLEWLNATDAFGKLVNGDYAAAVTDFSEWIILEPNSAVPFVARGLAHHYAGNAQLAKADFQQAGRLDPNAGKMIQELNTLVTGQPPAPNKKPGAKMKRKR